MAKRGQKKADSNNQYKDSQSRTQIIITIIGAVATVAVALIGILPTILKNNSEQPMPTAVVPTNTVVIPTTLITTDTPILPTATQPQGSLIPFFTWLGNPISESDLYSTGAKYTATSNGLEITGRYANDRIWIDKTLPINFSATISLTPYDNDCYFYAGFGDGNNIQPSFAWRFSGKTYFLKAPESGDESIYLTTNDTDFINANANITVILERDNDVIRLKEKDGKVVFRIQKQDDVSWLGYDTLNTFWIYAGFPGRECTIRINSINIDEVK